MEAAVRVRFRNARVPVLPHQRDFLCRFFQGMAQDHPDFLACVDLILTLVVGADPPMNSYDLLVAHKRDRFRSVERRRRFENLLARANMETLMLQGVRAVHVPVDRLQHEMRLIDLICLGLFGRIERLDPAVDEPLGEVEDLDDLAATIGALWR